MYKKDSVAEGWWIREGVSYLQGRRETGSGRREGLWSFYA